MGANQLKRMVKKAKLDISVIHTPVGQLTADADVVVVHKGLAKQARERVPGAVIVPFTLFVNDPAVKGLVATAAQLGRPDRLEVVNDVCRRRSREGPDSGRHRARVPGRLQGRGHRVLRRPAGCSRLGFSRVRRRNEAARGSRVDLPGKRGCPSPRGAGEQELHPLDRNSGGPVSRRSRLGARERPTWSSGSQRPVTTTCGCCQGWPRFSRTRISARISHSPAMPPTSMDRLTAPPSDD